MAKPTYIKTDKNGTKIYYDYTCSRCGGEGGYDGWKYTGYWCFKCGGSGLQDKPEIIKEYTEEYQAKLDAQRAKRAEKRLQEQIRKFNEEMPQMLADMGFSPEGKAWLVIGNTYDIKDELKMKGARWFNDVQHWAFAQDMPEYETIEIDAHEVLDFFEDRGEIEWKYSIDMDAVVNSKLPESKEEESDWIGNEGDRIEIDVTLDKWVQYEATAYGRNWMKETHNIFLLKAGNDTLKWDTTSWVEEFREAEVGSKFTIKATIKKHDVYRDEKQTVLTRVKILKREA